MERRRRNTDFLSECKRNKEQDSITSTKFCGPLILKTTQRYYKKTISHGLAFFLAVFIDVIIHVLILDGELQTARLVQLCCDFLEEREVAAGSKKLLESALADDSTMTQEDLDDVWEKADRERSTPLK